MTSDRDVIRRIVDAFDRSDWAEIDVRVGSLRVRLSANGDVAADSEAGPTRPTDAAPARPAAEPVDAEATGPPEARPPADLPPGAHLVVSPSPGIFWRSPQPGAPPFADVGEPVAPSTTLCIVEVMKLMTHVKAEVVGAVVAVFVDDGTRVDQGDPLFAIALEP